MSCSSRSELARHLPSFFACFISVHANVEMYPSMCTGTFPLIFLFFSVCLICSCELLPSENTRMRGGTREGMKSITLHLGAVLAIIPMNKYICITQIEETFFFRVCKQRGYRVLDDIVSESIRYAQKKNLPIRKANSPQEILSDTSNTKYIPHIVPQTRNLESQIRACFNDLVLPVCILWWIGLSVPFDIWWNHLYHVKDNLSAHQQVCFSPFSPCQLFFFFFFRSSFFPFKRDTGGRRTCFVTKTVSGPTSVNMPCTVTRVTTASTFTARSNKQREKR